MIPAYDEGSWARLNGIAYLACPYPAGPDRDQWRAGYDATDRDLRTDPWSQP